MIAPFGLLLAVIALGPMLWPKGWAKHYPKLAYALGAFTIGYYLFGLHAYGRLLETGHEYVSFIVLIGSLFVVSGGIHFVVKGEATPATNTLYLLIGAVLANLLGTTGASMLLIRPWIRMNRGRVAGHHIVFFIFIVSNVGGCLTPVGDPPLFLGYLKGVPFWWVARHCWPIWAVGVGFLLALFYCLDALNYRRTSFREVRLCLAEQGEEWRFEGLWNIAYLAVILGAVFIDHPVFLRETLMAAAAVASYFSTKKQVREANQFDLRPLREVAILFVGIFATMLPALDWLQGHAGRVASPGPGFFYWSCGALSSLLDNAPTYLSFLSATFGSFVEPEVVEKVQFLVQNHGAGLATLTGAHADQIRRTFEALRSYSPAGLAAGNLDPDRIRVAFLLGSDSLNRYLVAISIGAVFFGANTYIGNGPNFMVKAIADQQKVRTPGFAGFIFKYTLPCMAPMLILIWALFFRG